MTKPMPFSENDFALIRQSYVGFLTDYLDPEQDINHPVQLHNFTLIKRTRTHYDIYEGDKIIIARAPLSSCLTYITTAIQLIENVVYAVTLSFKDGTTYQREYPDAISRAYGVKLTFDAAKLVPELDIEQVTNIGIDVPMRKEVLT